jgi:hypothetical protein
VASPAPSAVTASSEILAMVRGINLSKTPWLPGGNHHEVTES